MTTFDKAVLRAVANTLATNHETEVVRYAADKAEFLAEERKLHVNIDRMRQLRDTLTQSIKTGKFPTRQEIRNRLGVGQLDDMFYGGGGSWGLDKAIGYPPSTTQTEAATEARALVVFLDSITDDTITTNALKSVGFTRLAPVFKAAATAAAKAAREAE